MYLSNKAAKVIWRVNQSIHLCSIVGLMPAPTPKSNLYYFLSDWLHLIVRCSVHTQLLSGMLSENWERHLSETDSCTNCFWCCSQFSLKSHSIVMWRNCVITTLLCYKISPTLLLKSLIYGRNGWTMMLTNLIRTQVWFAMLHWRAFYCIGNVFVMICYRWYWNFIFWSRFWTLFDFVSKVTLSLYHYSWWDGA